MARLIALCCLLVAEPTPPELVATAAALQKDKMLEKYERIAVDFIGPAFVLKDKTGKGPEIDVWRAAVKIDDLIALTKDNELVDVKMVGAWKIAKFFTKDKRTRVIAECAAWRVQIIIPLQKAPPDMAADLEGLCERTLAEIGPTSKADP